MENNQLVSIVDYLRLGSTIHEEHLNTIRDMYNELINQMSIDINELNSPDEIIITEITRRLKIRNDTDETLKYLCDCVRYTDINDAKMVINGRILGAVEPLDETISGTGSTALPPQLLSVPSVDLTENETILDRINCVLNIKMMVPEVQKFIHLFLLQEIDKPGNIVTTLNGSTTETSNRYNEPVLLINCLLDLFIRQQLYERSPIISFGRQNSTHFRLIEPISMTDDFSTWQYDHWHGLFDLIIEPFDRKNPFPTRWRLSDDADIYFRINDNDSTVKTSFSSVHDKPRTTSLHAFVNDVCARENNGQSKIWLNKLQREDILTFEHLANLSQSEWDRIQGLSMHAKKTLKTAIDQERVNITNKPYRRKQIDSDNHDDEIFPTNTKEDSSYSHSEILANLHLIKLFIWHSLHNDSRIQQYGALPKLETECLKEAFNEMRNDGFADDDLFPKIQEFFYPLTISEYEIRQKRQIKFNRYQIYIKERDQLKMQIKQRKEQIITQRVASYNLAYEYDLLKEKLKKTQMDYSRNRESIQSRPNDRQQQRNAQELKEIDEQWKRTQLELNRKLKILDEKKKKMDKEKNEFEKQNEEDENKLVNIERELSKPRTNIDNQLVKPARGLIMYGPPGTGKSQIMSQLAKKLGIFMVGEPLAAGELNRPYVGESERILVALCTRCHRIPYAMCCISIDEIDSLAPKRDEDSSEGKVDKISVLLSLIEGIKDVPNLMILCATNRLHMMDEAFLRRMSGKFFVGRPSSNARLTMLEKIPEWALKFDLINLLTRATTNFSGAAVKALTQAITVKAMVVQRTEPNYEINDREALKIADHTAQRYQIFFGSETLPRLFLRNSSSKLQKRIQELSNHIDYTGRIVIDLYDGYVRIEIRTRNENNDDNYLSIVEQGLKLNEVNVQTLLERLSIYGQNRNVQLLQLIDLNLLASQGAYDEKKVFETLKDRYDECCAYTRSMIVYDLDALVGVNKSESDSNMGRSTSSSVVNASIYTYIRARFRDCAIEEKQEIDRIERWAVAIIREPFLLRQFCSDVQFARTPEEEDKLDLEKHKSEVQLKCVKCKDFYIENENKMGNCIHHDGFIYDNSSADLTRYKSSDVMMLLNQLECEILINSEQRDELERQKTKFKWICCDITFTNGCSGGCKKGKHGFENNDDDLRERYTTGRADRLEQTTIIKWEEACLYNQEYNEKWLRLLSRRLEENN